jgi:hypothetical protein
MKMIERIKLNEERYDKIKDTLKDLEISLNNFNNIKKDYKLLNKYYGSKNWFKDKEAYENNKIPRIKAGVLSEDGVWNMLDNVNEIINDMKKIINDFEKNKN